MDTVRVVGSVPRVVGSVPCGGRYCPACGGDTVQVVACKSVSENHTSAPPPITPTTLDMYATVLLCVFFLSVFVSSVSENQMFATHVLSPITPTTLLFVLFVFLSAFEFVFVFVSENHTFATHVLSHPPHLTCTLLISSKVGDMHFESGQILCTACPSGWVSEVSWSIG